MGRSLYSLAKSSPFKKDSQILMKLGRKYGCYLEKLSCKSRLALRAVLSRYVYEKSFIISYLIIDAIADTLPVIDFGDKVTTISQEMQGLSDFSIESLIQILTLQQIKGFDTQ